MVTTTRLLLTVSLCALVAAQPLFADGGETPEVPVILWPDSPAIPLRIGKRSIIFDEVPATITEFTGGALRITSDSGDGWITWLCAAAGAIRSREESRRCIGIDSSLHERR